MGSEEPSAVGPDPKRERRHTPEPGEPRSGVGSWSESHRLCAIDVNGGPAVALQITIRLAGDVGLVAEFRCAVFGMDALPVVVAADEIPVPADRWEFRTSGLWADHVCETPFVHWSYGLEAFGLAIDDPDELLGRGYGNRVPVGWELEFESEPVNVDSGGGDDGLTGLDQQAGRIDGLLLGAGGELAIAGPAVRSHRWGPDGSKATAHRSGSVSSTPDRNPAASTSSASLPMGPDAASSRTIWRLDHQPGVLSWSCEPAP